jgi:uncharacterized protein (DUF433 family)
LRSAAKRLDALRGRSSTVERASPRDAVIVRRPGVMGGAACFLGTRVNFETLFVNLVADDLDTIVDESFPTLDRDDCIAALERGAVLVAEAGLLTREEAQLLFGLLGSKWHVSLDGFLDEYPEVSRDRCVAALRYAGAALAAEAEFEQQADRLDAAAALAVRILRRTGQGGDFAIALCSEAETEADVYRWLAGYLLGGDALARAARGEEP